MGNNLQRKMFKEINLMDPFFDSLKADYKGFEGWFQRKGDQYAFVQYNKEGMLTGFLYFKIEMGSVSDVEPIITANRILKVGTFKIDAHGTKLGEQFIKVIMDYALNESVDLCYVTIYEKDRTQPLIKLIERFGFKRYGTKGSSENCELVLVKDMKHVTGEICKDYPIINLDEGKKFLLSIYPQYHSIMLPHSILTTENKNIIKDISYTNSIHKIYVCSMKGVENLKCGDILVLYRTAEKGKNAEYSSVATSICVVEEVKAQSSFSNFEEFYKYASQYSVFDKNDLNYWYKKGNLKAIKFTYNVALTKRVVRHDLIEKIGLDRDIYWGFFELTENEFVKIAELGKVSEIIKNRTNVPIRC